MTSPHDRKVKARQKAAQEVLVAFDDLCEAAGLPVEDEESL